MTIIANYPSKKVMKETAIGTKFKGWNPSMFSTPDDIPANGKFAVCNRPHLTGHKREFFATVTTVNGLITKVA